MGRKYQPPFTSTVAPETWPRISNPRSGAPQFQVVESGDAELILERNDYRPLIAEGDYKAVYARHEVAEVRRFDKQPKLYSRVRLVEPFYGAMPTPSAATRRAWPSSPWRKAG